MVEDLKNLSAKQQLPVASSPETGKKEETPIKVEESEKDAKEDAAEKKTEEKPTETKIEETTKVEEKTAAETKDEKKGEDIKKPAKIVKVKKDKAVVNGKDLGISTKHSMAICDYIRGKNIESMIADLGKVAKVKKAIPMKGEIPHRKGKMMSGRYPVNASKVFITLLKGLNANASVNGLENPVIVTAVANRASRPHRRGGRERFKRTNVVLIAKEKGFKESSSKNKPKQEKK